MDINGLNGLSSQYQPTTQNAAEVGDEEGAGQQPQVQSNESPFGHPDNETDSDVINQTTQVLQSLLHSVAGALSNVQSLQRSQEASHGEPAETSGEGSQQARVPPGTPQVQGSGETGQQQPPAQPGGAPPAGSHQTSGSSAGTQDQAGLIKVAQILQTLLGSLLGAIPFFGSALSSLTAGIARSAHSR